MWVTRHKNAAEGKADPMDPANLGTIVNGALAMSPVSAALRGGVRAAGGMLAGVSRAPEAKELAAPTSDALRAAADAGYTQARGLGVAYHAGAVGDMASSVAGALAEKGITDELAPSTYSLLAKLQNAPAGAFVPFGGLDAARKAFGIAGRNFTNPTEQLAARHAQDAIDDFVVAAHPDTVLHGPADKVGAIVGEARGNYAASKRVDQLSGVA